MNARQALFIAVVAFSLGCPSTSSTPDVDEKPKPSVYYQEAPPEADENEVPVTVVREFICDPEAVGSQMPVADTVGAPGEGVVIEPGAAPCSFTLVYQAGASRSVLSSAPSGFLLTAARKFSDGVRAVCASEVVHRDVGSGRREVDEVLLHCWTSATASFTATTVAVKPDGAWAAWIHGLEPIPGRTGAFYALWARDFSFQFMNMSDQGRPETDGIYRTELFFDGGALTVGATTKVSSRTNPFAGTTARPWVPTPEDLEEFQRYGPP